MQDSETLAVVTLTIIILLIPLWRAIWRKLYDFVTGFKSKGKDHGS